LQCGDERNGRISMPFHEDSARNPRLSVPAFMEGNPSILGMEIHHREWCRVVPTSAAVPPLVLPGARCPTATSGYPELGSAPA